jgi:hypothetical protein
MKQGWLARCQGEIGLPGRHWLADGSGRVAEVSSAIAGGEHHRGGKDQLAHMVSNQAMF